MPSTWFITGASRGFGRERTEQLLARGDRVAATLRKPEQLDDLAATYGNRLWVRPLDVTNTDAMRRVVGEAFADLDRIDVVVSNAGYGLVGAAEELTDAQVDRMIATNLPAGIQLARAVTPHLRAQGGGRILRMSSMGGRILRMSSMGGFIGYTGFSLCHTTKWGIEGFYECFAGEVEPFGIRTTLIEPGMIRTSFYDAVQKSPVLEAYKDNPAIWRGDINLQDMPGDQAKVVKAMLDVAGAGDPPRRMLPGSDFYQLVTTALADRLAAFKDQKDLAFSTDVDDHQPATS